MFTTHNFPLVPLNSELMYTGKPHSGEGDLHTIPSFDDVQNEPDYKSKEVRNCISNLDFLPLVENCYSLQQKQKKYDI